MGFDCYLGDKGGHPTISPLSRQASSLLQPSPIELAEAPARSDEWRRSLASWTMRSGQADEAQQVGEQLGSNRRRVESGSSAAGAPRGQQPYRG